ncbi:hypothetical protein NPX13_g3926 [Xylaria arbuscula]|uniref:Peptidase C14 caspase domain-containing protein n=1 Tax=Xylaria arbuscula TaxID=114810 RepID=A0A9W8NHB7_9PEZI|nr:hypothetical protein NPX13_g3926 [Xylaria arbuscula]
MLSSSQDGNRPQKWAVLIGINYYIPGKARWPVRARHLSGCVNDVEVVEAYLIKHQNVDRQRIRKLTASRSPISSSNRPLEPEHEWPTYANMKLAIERVTADANPDDIVYIHYSGHGGRALTLIPNVKSGNPNLVGRPGIDEVLIPTDINQGGRYLRDIELAYLLKKMVTKGLHVTVVIDSCHSGGMGRNNPEESQSTRSIQGTGPDGVDWASHPTDVSDIPQAELESTGKIGIWSSNSTRGLPPQGWVMLSACQPHEKAAEGMLTIDGIGPKPFGYLTYGLYSSLLKAPRNLAYSALFRRAQEMMRGPGRQTPVIMGNIHRQMFLDSATETTYSIPVLHLDTSRLHLQAGRAHGVCEGDIFGIYSWDTSHIDISSPQLATAKVDVVQSINAEAILQSNNGEKVTQGSHAVLLRRALRRVTLHLKIMLCSNTTDTGKSKLERLNQLDLSNINLTTDIVIENTRQENAQGSGINFQYNVTVNRGGEYLLHESDDLSKTTLPPSDSPESLLKLLNHLGLYDHYRALQGPHSTKIDFDFEPPPSSSFRYTPHRNVIEIVDGTTFILNFLNKTTNFLYISVFYFSASRGIFRVYPPSQIGDYEEVDWGHQRELDIRPEFPTAAMGQEFIVETLKIFVTTKPTSFRVLENVLDLNPKLNASEQTLSRRNNQQQQLHDTLQTYDTPQNRDRAVPELSDSSQSAMLRSSRGKITEPRPMHLENVRGGTGEGWQTKNIIVHIYPRAADLQWSNKSKHHKGF